MNAVLVAALIIVGLIFIAMGLLRPDFNLMLSCSPDSFFDRSDRNYSDYDSKDPNIRTNHE